MSDFGKLYVVATPIGNLSETSKRTLDILNEVDLIACEDTRQTIKLLNHFEIKKKMESYHRHNEEEKSKKLIEYLKNGKNIALVSDAGMPGICDPGHEIIDLAIKENIDIIPISGPCSFVNALVGSGLDTSEFIFLGFLPLNKKNRAKKIEEIRDANKTIIIFEAPHKLKQTIKDLKQNLDENRKITIARELTKIHEEFIRTNLKDVEQYIENIKGEIVILIEKNQNQKNLQTQEQINQLDENELYEQFLEQGLSKKDAIKKIAKIKNVPKNEIYKLFINK